MIVWGTNGRRLDLGLVEERHCGTCGQQRPFRLFLSYSWFHLYWVFRLVSKKQYFLACETCQGGWELDSGKIEGALGKSPIPARDRYGLAAFGAAVVAVVGYVVVTLPPAASRDQMGTISNAGSLSAFQVKVGDCFNNHEGTSVESVAAVPCWEPHENEVYAVVRSDLTGFPGEQMGDIAADVCAARFESFVGETYENSVLDILMLHPTNESWTRRGDREIVCAVYDMNSTRLIGTVRGSRK